MKNKTSKFFLTLTVYALLAGCAGFRQNFKEKHAVNFSPFADMTVGLLSSLNYELTPNEVFLIRPYANLEDPRLAQLRVSIQLEQNFLKGIMAYSMEIVNLSESGKQPADQVKAYREYVAGLIDAANQMGDKKIFPEEKTNKILSQIAEKKSLLEAMQTAQPIITEFNQINARLIRDITNNRSAIVNDVQNRIDEKFKDFVVLDLQLRKEKADLARRLALGKGDKKSLTDQMIIIKKRQEIIAPDLDVYRELKMKMDAMAKQHDDMIRAGGRAILLWAQAHQSMANGVTNPAEWFSMGDVKNAVFGAGKKVLP